MDLLTLSLLLMFALLLSNIVGHYLPAIPIALIQIIFGVIIAVMHGDYSFQIGADWFLLLFVAPLLFNDGRNFSREELWGMRTQIFGNAVILVILTTVICGYVIYQLIPGMPLAAALALAAILSPTDPVAVNGIAKRIHIPEKVMVIVRGESLINDASGLVAFKYAIAAAITGYFSLSEALIDFSYTFLAGAIAGIIFGLIIIFVRFRLRKTGIQDPVFHSLLHILTPFAIYIMTEHFLHASGIIAVVAAGIIHAVVAERTETHLAQEHLLTENAWSILLFVLNGFVFLMLGMNIPSAMFNAVTNHEVSVGQALGYVVVVSFAVLAVRFIWTLISEAFNYSRKKDSAEKPTVRGALITTLVGVRGAVTMAGILTVPTVLGSGEPFPLRPLIIFIAAGVILLLLIISTILLPLLCRKGAHGENVEKHADLTWAKNKLLLTAIEKIKAETNEENAAAAMELINEYTTSFHQNLSARQSGKQEQYNQKIIEIRIMALNLERKHTQELLDSGEIDIEIFDTLNQILDFREEALDNSFRFGMLLFLQRVKREFGRLLARKGRGEHGLDEIHIIRDIRIKIISKVIKELKEHAKTLERPEYVYAVQLDYERLLRYLKRSGDRYDGKLEEKKEELRFKVLDAERNEIRRMFEAGEITAAQEKELRRFTNYIEGIVLYEPLE